MAASLPVIRGPYAIPASEQGIKHYITTISCISLQSEHSASAQIERNTVTPMSEAVTLASSLPLPVPANDGEECVRRVPSKRQSLKIVSDKHLSNPTDHVIPYQALPVQGPVISLNYTPALAVLEPDHLRKEVILRRQCTLSVCLIVCQQPVLV